MAHVAPSRNACDNEFGPNEVGKEQKQGGVGSEVLEEKTEVRESGKADMLLTTL